MDEKVRQIRQELHDKQYTIAEENLAKPWGGYLRLVNEEADRFIEQFFPGLSALEARLGRFDIELSPKILIVAPGQRLSWQYHDRRAERWVFLTDGAYICSHTDEQQAPAFVTQGAVVQFDQGERHRLVGLANAYVVVAEIWQHTDPEHPSDEDDITRLTDDYDRSSRA